MLTDPHEIRYRAIADQREGFTDFLSNVIKFIERARDIKYQDYIEKADIGHGGLVSILDTENGKADAAVLPVWNMTFAESISKRGSFIINTTYINAPGECHMNSPELYRWRIANSKTLKTKGNSILWGKLNPYC
jgi:hypothetical protein